MILVLAGEFCELDQLLLKHVINTDFLECRLDQVLSWNS